MQKDIIFTPAVTTEDPADITLYRVSEVENKETHEKETKNLQQGRYSKADAKTLAVEFAKQSENIAEIIAELQALSQ